MTIAECIVVDVARWLSDLGPTSMQWVTERSLSKMEYELTHRGWLEPNANLIDHAYALGWRP